jgi:hypothetical protein
MRRAGFAVLLALTIPLLQGCSLLGKSTRGEVVNVEVNNNLQIPTPITIYTWSDVGSRQLVGSVSPGSHATLHFRAPHITGNYRLVARVSSQTQGDYLVSNAVALTGGETITWDVRSNVVLVARER